MATSSRTSRAQDTVRDMDRIRAAVGDDSLSYRRVLVRHLSRRPLRRALPGPCAGARARRRGRPAARQAETNVQQALAFESSLDAFFEWCAERETVSSTATVIRPPRSTGSPPNRRPAAARRRPPARSGRVRPRRDRVPVRRRAGVPRASLDGLAAAADGDGEPLLEQSDDYTGRRERRLLQNEQEAFWAIGCLDGPRLGGPEAYRAAEPQVDRAAPLGSGRPTSTTTGLRHWPVPPVPAAEPARRRRRGADPRHRHDRRPRHPDPVGPQLRGQLDSGVFVEVEGTTHTSFLSLDECVDRLVSRYLVRLDVPAARDEVRRLIAASGRGRDGVARARRGCPGRGPRRPRPRRRRHRWRGPRARGQGTRRRASARR